MIPKLYATEEGLCFESDDHSWGPNIIPWAEMQRYLTMESMKHTPTPSLSHATPEDQK